MTLRELKIFLTVCEQRSMSEAARVLYMTQPAISQTIADLEEKLNVKLFDRINKKLILTYAGEILLQYGKKISSLLDEVESTIEDIANMRIGKLRIGASTTIGVYLLPNLIGEFSTTYKNIDIPFVIENTGIIEKMILDNLIDIGIVEGLIHSKDIIVSPYLDDELYLVCSQEHKWARNNRTTISPEELSHENIIIREPGSGTREIFEEAMARKNIKYHSNLVLSSTEAIKKAVQANIGVSVISKVAVQEEILQNRLCKINVHGLQFKRSFNVILHKDKYHSRLLGEFIKFLGQHGNVS